MLDKPRILKFDLNSFAELEELFGSIDLAMKALEKGTIKGIRTLLRCGLMHEEETLTDKKVGSIVGLTDLQDLSEKITIAMTASLPPVVTKATKADIAGEEPGNSQPSQ